jgi:hypothetical protein
MRGLIITAAEAYALFTAILIACTIAYGNGPLPLAANLALGTSLGTVAINGTIAAVWSFIKLNREIES